LSGAFNELVEEFTGRIVACIVTAYHWSCFADLKMVFIPT
jgi:hypothetical protein